ncbi:MAG: glucosyltransferase [Mameliella sp.]|nr:glucosyltransferase [Mameliella sp.]|tara:strand:- start:7983 stop:9203 length:1221 start_codon:yes stop_codon:yes gene_type:complete
MRRRGDGRRVNALEDNRLRGIYIGVDATNPTLILRIRSFLRAGAELTAFTFRRHKFNTDYQPEWANVHLGDTVDRNYLRRLPALGRALWRMLENRQTFRAAQFIYARNMDLLFLGLLARWLTRSKAALVYEVEDVQEVFFKKTVSGALFRWLEGWALKRIDLLVVMSPGFLRGYFEPVQGYQGRHFVLENKLQLGDLPETPTPSGRVWEDITDRWVIGWFGTLRCPRSMALLEEIAEALGPKVEIYTRGYPTETGLEAYLEVVDRHENWIYDGEYTIPDDLEQMYGRVHFSWCLDFLDPDGNSPLLLACRMYQGGFYGAVPLVVEDTEMDRWLAEAGIGHTFGPPYAESIIAFLQTASPADYRAERAQIMERRRELFLEDGRDTRAMLETIGDLAASRQGMTSRRL